MTPGLAVRRVPGALHDGAFLELKVQRDHQVERPDGSTGEDQLEHDARNHSHLGQTAAHQSQACKERSLGEEEPLL